MNTFLKYAIAISMICTGVISQGFLSFEATFDGSQVKAFVNDFQTSGDAYSVCKIGLPILMAHFMQNSQYRYYTRAATQATMLAVDGYFLGKNVAYKMG